MKNVENCHKNEMRNKNRKLSLSTINSVSEAVSQPARQSFMQPDDDVIAFDC